MVRLSLLLVLSLSLGALGAKTGAKGSTKAAAKKADDGRCSASKLCPKTAPCCSSAGYCGSGAEHCLAGCNPTSSFSPLSCRALPRCNARAIDFTNSRNPTVPLAQYNGDPSTAQMTLDSGVLRTGAQGLYATVGQSGEAAAGATISTTDYIMYGRVTATMRHKNDKGVVGTFIFFSPTGDEIDFEITAGKARQVQLNMFWQGQSLHGADGNSQIITMPQGFDTADWHAYTLDWNAQRIVYSIDGQAVKTIYRKDFKDDKGRFQYPATPMRAQVSVWDSSRMAKGTQKWTGGKPDYANADQYGTFTTQLKSLTIECNDPSSLSAGRNYGFSKKLDAKSGEPAVIGTDRASTV